MILKSDAEVLPIYFSGQNSRWFQFANKISITIRQGLLLHEIVHAMNKEQAPIAFKTIYNKAAARSDQGSARNTQGGHECVLGCTKRPITQ